MSQFNSRRQLRILGCVLRNGLHLVEVALLYRNTWERLSYAPFAVYHQCYDVEALVFQMCDTELVRYYCFVFDTSPVQILLLVWISKQIGRASCRERV